MRTQRVDLLPPPEILCLHGARDPIRKARMMAARPANAVTIFVLLRSQGAQER